MNNLMETKKERYELLCQQVESLAEGEANKVGVLANVSAAMKSVFPLEFFWVGFYLVNEEGGKSDASRSVLQLGPFQGTVACYTIPFGRGVCGAAWAVRRTIVVPDVEAFPGHIACSSLSRSEIVVPIFGAGGDVAGVIDIDSTELNTFDSTDAQYLEKIAKILSKLLHF